MALSDIDVRTTKVPYGKNQYKISDGGGLYLLVKSSGRYWKLAYRFDGKQKTLAFGVYPSVSLEQAREKREEAKVLLEQNIDPGLIRKQERMEQRVASMPPTTTEPDPELISRNDHPYKLQPVALNQIEQNMIEDRRLCILQTLVHSNTYMLDENMLRTAIDSIGYKLSFDRLRTDIAWLYEQQLVHIEASTTWGIYLTQYGLDAACGRMWIPGVKRPASDQYS